MAESFAENEKKCCFSGVKAICWDQSGFEYAALDAEPHEQMQRGIQ